MDTKERERTRPQGRENPVSAKTGTKRRTGTREKQAPKRNASAKQERVSPDVVYLPPKPLNRSRLALKLLTVVAVVIALVLGVSVFFKVDGIEVSGNDKYSAWDICQASGIKEGDHLLTFSRAQAASKIITALPYVESVRIGIKLPGTVKIDIVEAKVPYAVQASDDTWWLVTSSGKVIEKALAGEETGYTRILGVRLDTPKSGSQAVAKENNQPQTDEQGNTVPVMQTQAKRLETALNIAEYLELNGIIGKAATIEVEDLGDIRFWYGQRYQVKLGDDTQLLYKISFVKSAIDQMNEYQSGILDASFTSKPDGVVYKAFDE